jgi:hypothetical protein
MAIEATEIKPDINEGKNEGDNEGNNDEDSNIDNDKNPRRKSGHESCCMFLLLTKVAAQIFNVRWVHACFALVTVCVSRQSASLKGSTVKPSMRILTHRRRQSCHLEANLL